MERKCSVLILTAGYGNGHNQAANALAHSLRDQGCGLVRIMDLFEEAYPGFNAFTRYLYMKSPLWTARGLDRAVATVRSVPRPTDAFTRTVSPDVEDLPIDDYDALNVAQAVAAVKDLEIPADIRNVIAYEEAHKDRHGVVSAAQTRLAAIAQDVVGINT